MVNTLLLRPIYSFISGILSFLHVSILDVQEMTTGDFSVTYSPSWVRHKNNLVGFKGFDLMTPDPRVLHQLALFDDRLS